VFEQVDQQEAGQRRKAKRRLHKILDTTVQGLTFHAPDWFLARTFSRKTHSTGMLAGQTTLDVFSDPAQREKLKAGARAETIRDMQ
jgi:hypothetical protein